MNTAQTSDKKMQQNTGALTHIHDIKSSARNFTKSKKTQSEGYSKSFLTDSELIFKFIMKKVGGSLRVGAPKADYDCEFWYTEGEHQGNYTEEASHRVECGSDSIVDWFMRNQVFLTSVREKVPKIKLVPATSPDNEVSDTDSDMEFDLHNF